MNWYSPKEKMPPQGKKILYFNKGDVYVVQRLNKFWLPIPFFDSKFSFHEKPELWADIELPGTYTGYLRLSCGGELLTLDEIQNKYPKTYGDFIKYLLALWGIRNDLDK